MKKKLPKINKIAEGRKKGKKVLYKIFSGVLDFEILRPLPLNHHDVEKSIRFTFFLLGIMRPKIQHIGLQTLDKK